GPDSIVFLGLHRVEYRSCVASRQYVLLDDCRGHGPADAHLPRRPTAGRLSRAAPPERRDGKPFAVGTRGSSTLASSCFDSTSTENGLLTFWLAMSYHASMSRRPF